MNINKNLVNKPTFYVQTKLTYLLQIFIGDQKRVLGKATSQWLCNN